MTRLMVHVVASIALMLTPSAGQAMDFTFRPFKDKPDRGVIVAAGEIQLGDDEKLHDLVAALPGNTVLIGMFLNSPGGSLLEGVRMATTIRNTGLATAAVGVCASACFLMFAAGTRKLALNGARIGVHSASVEGAETLESQAVTTQMARQAAEFGVPPAVIGKMVTTAAADIAWLSKDDLRSMDVELVNTRQASYEPGSPLRPGGASAASAGVGPAGPVPQVPTAPQQAASVETVLPADASPAFLAGRRARMEYEAWFNSVSGDARAGAEWWAGVRSRAQRDHLTCETGTPLWVVGCKQARTMLAPSDSRRRAEPDFRAGWNSL